MLSASQTCSASVRFAPTGAGAKSATLVFTTNAGDASVALAGNAVAPPPVVASTVVEYYHAAYDHYFITIGADEIAALDTGVFFGWARTGLSFKAHATAQPGFASICRFYLPPGYGDTHFYSASPAECAIVHQQNPAFQLETTAAMYLATPGVFSGRARPAPIRSTACGTTAPTRITVTLRRAPCVTPWSRKAMSPRERPRRRDVLRAPLNIRP
jgi:hypothetical protein